MENLIGQQIVMLEIWTREVRAADSARGVLRRSVEIAREHDVDRNDPFFVLCALSELRAIDGVPRDRGLNLKPDHLRAWFDGPTATDIWTRGRFSDVSLDPLNDMLQAVNTLNRYRHEQFRRYSAQELAIGTLASTSTLVRAYCKNTGRTREKRLAVFELSPQETYILLEGRHQQKRNLHPGRVREILRR